MYKKWLKICQILLLSINKLKRKSVNHEECSENVFESLKLSQKCHVPVLVKQAVDGL